MQRRHFLQATAAVATSLAGPMYAAARASGRDKLPEIDQLCDFSVMQEVHASLKKS